MTSRGADAWLVTGGAGYIGAHLVRELAAQGMTPIVYDDLSTGFATFVPAGVPFVEGDVLDAAELAAVLREHDVTGVIHCAGYKYAGESVKRPLHTYRQNVAGTAGVLEAMDAAGVGSLVFSSSAGVYGTPTAEVVTEQTPTAPESPYGESKLAAEWLIRAQVRATRDSATPLAATSLRYFNVVGSVGTEVYDASPYNLFPRVFATLLRGEAPVINGGDYATPDGTCIRDYVHVGDLARAHVAAARALSAGTALEDVYNLGSGSGTSVRAIVDAMAEVTGIEREAIVGPRRPGDPARIVADGTLAARDLGWANTSDVRDMVATAWAAQPGR